MPQKRLTGLGLSFLLLLLTVAAYLAVLVLGQGNELRAAASAQRLRSFDYYQYARGDIFDRYGRALVNVEEPSLVVLPAMARGREGEIAGALADILEIDQKLLQQRLLEADAGSYQPVVLKTGLSSAEAHEVEQAALPGVMVLSLAARYDHAHTACQLLGTVQQGEGGVYVGKSGLEAHYDELLRGREDIQVEIQVDAAGSSSGQAVLSQPEQTRASALYLTLDKDHQQIAEQALSEMGLSGCCVVMEPNSGDILALASYPAFDPYGWEAAAEGAYLQRALLTYPPASTFKTVLAAAAVAEGVRPKSASYGEEGDEQGDDAADHGADAEIDDETDDENDVDDEDAADDEGDEAPEESSPVFVCSGSYTLSDGRVVSCAGGHAHGEVDLARALTLSCNCYFVALGEALGGERVLSYCERLGLDSLSISGYPTAISGGFLDFDGDLAGELANACLGESGVSISPVQAAALFSCFVNGGYLVQPRLVTASIDSTGRSREYVSTGPRRAISAATAEALRLMLTQVVEEGTGQAARGRFVTAGGKTGSSETGTVWFSGFFPAEQPRLVLVVCLENGSSGGAEAAAVFSRVADAITLLDGRI